MLLPNSTQAAVGRSEFVCVRTGQRALSRRVFKINPSMVPIIQMHLLI